MNNNIEFSEFLNDFSNNCKIVQKKAFKKRQTVTTYIQKRNQVGILLSGEAELLRYDLNGNKTIIERFTKNDLFGEAFYTVTVNNELFIEAKTNCEVLFFVYDAIYHKCRINCKFHSTLVENFSDLLLTTMTSLNTRVEILSKRSTRDKLLAYFSLLSTRTLNKTLQLPFSLTDLADYLSVDRSAMMRELKLLKDEGFIEKHKNKITLLYK